MANIIFTEWLIERITNGNEPAINTLKIKQKCVPSPRRQMIGCYVGTFFQKIKKLYFLENKQKIDHNK